MDYKRNEYIIPVNYDTPGAVMNGMISFQKMVDIAWLALVGFLIARLVPVSPEKAVSVYVLFIGFFAFIGFIGVPGQNIPISTFLIDLLDWRRRRKPYLYNNHGAAYSLSAADVMLNTPDFRDSLADALDKAWNTMRKKQPEYIEGETFQFADDPELVEIEEAERRIQEEAEEEKTATATTKKQKQDAAPSTELNFDQISQNIILHDIEEE